MTEFFFVIFFVLFCYIFWCFNLDQKLSIDAAKRQKPTRLRRPTLTKKTQVLFFEILQHGFYEIRKTLKHTEAT